MKRLFTGFINTNGAFSMGRANTKSAVSYAASGRATMLAHPHYVGLLFNPKALWIGAHYGEHHKRWCVNILPCITVWWTKPGGYLP